MLITVLILIFPSKTNIFEIFFVNEKCNFSMFLRRYYDEKLNNLVYKDNKMRVPLNEIYIKKTLMLTT